MKETKIWQLDWGFCWKFYWDLTQGQVLTFLSFLSPVQSVLSLFLRHSIFKACVNNVYSILFCIGCACLKYREQTSFSPTNDIINATLFQRTGFPFLQKEMISCPCVLQIQTLDLHLMLLNEEGEIDFDIWKFFAHSKIIDRHCDHAGVKVLYQILWGLSS